MIGRVSAKRAPRPPDGLQTAGQAVWRAILAAFELKPGELEDLEQLARTKDHIMLLEEALNGADVVVEGHGGQPRVNPLFSEIREQRKLADQLIRALALPWPGESEGRLRDPAQAQKAQQRQRWVPARGA